MISLFFLRFGLGFLNSYSQVSSSGLPARWSRFLERKNIEIFSTGVSLTVIGKKEKNVGNTIRSKLKNMTNNIKHKIHHKQTEFFGDRARNRWIFGGNRTGKTHAGAFEGVTRAINGKKVGGAILPTEGWVVSLSTQVQRDVAQRKVLEILTARGVTYECVMQSGKADSPSRGIIDFISVFGNAESPSRIGFKNCEQGREKFQGTRLDWVWFDEEPTEDIYDECLLRTLDNGGFVWGTMTPLKGKTWIYERIYKNGKLFCKANRRKNDGISIHSWQWADNPFLNEREIIKMEKNFSAEALESRRFGLFADGIGLVFKEFGEKNIVKNVTVSQILKTSVYNGISIDPGYINPTAVLWFAVDADKNIFVIDEYKESGKSVEQIAEAIYRKSNAAGVPVANVFIDSASTAQTLGEPKSVAEQFRAYGVPVDTRVEKNVLDGIHRIKSLFQSSCFERKLFIFEHCVHLIRELRGYFWGDKDKPVKRDDHCLDALRYFVMSMDNLKRVEKAAKVEDKIEHYKRRLLWTRKEL
jgi:PBSX family phage terminase large subunit